jgi:hypothetical protein
MEREIITLPALAGKSGVCQFAASWNRNPGIEGKTKLTITTGQPASKRPFKTSAPFRDAEGFGGACADKRSVDAGTVRGHQDGSERYRI